MTNKTSSSMSLSRRKFLKGSGVSALAASGAMLGVAQAGQEDKQGNVKSKTPYDYDVVVVGGGFAGITAARDLQKSGLKTLLLEARNRLGGRTFTTEFAGHELELGGSLVHWLQPHIWNEIQRYDIDIFDANLASADRTLIKTDDGKVVEATMEQMISVVEAFHKYMAEAKPNWEAPFDTYHTKKLIDANDHKSAYDRFKELDLTDVQKTAVDSFLGTLACGSTKDAAYNELLRLWALGNWNLDGFFDSVARYKIKGGTQTLVNAIVDDGGFEIRMGTPVASIESKSDHALITTEYENETISAAYVVSALPINVVGDVKFRPALSKGKMAAYSEKHSGSKGLMFNAELKGDLGTVMGMASSDAPLMFFGTYARTDEHTVVNGIVGDVSNLDVQDDKAIEAAIQEFLPEAEVLSSIAYDWISDPYSKGPYSLYKQNWTKDYLDDILKPEGRVHFAGSEFTEGWRCYMSGAIGSGIKAADKIRKLLA